MNTYDLCVIGAGSGGLVAATTGHRLGLKTVLLEKNKVGGECTHTGCVPSKTIIHSSKQFNAMKHAERDPRAVDRLLPLPRKRRQSAGS